MKTIKIISIGTVCFAVVFAIAILVASSLSGLIGDQQERNYYRFVQNVDGLTNTFREPVEECAVKSVKENNNGCFETIDEEYRIQFGSLIKLFGYESHIQELYLYWQADLQYWYDTKKAELQYSENPNQLDLELQKISDVKDKSVSARMQPHFATIVESAK